MSKAICPRPLLIGILAGMTAVSTQAQLSIEEIVVTARRVSESLQDVPISMTVFNQKDLDKRNITIAQDLAIYTPSLSVDQRYGPEKSSFAIRGFNQDYNTAPTVGVYFADVVGVRAQGGTTSGNTIGAGAFMDLENVQILKGPQGTLFGRNTNGGAILLVPKKPTDALEGYAEVSMGNYDMRRFQATLNVPVSDSFRLRFSVDDYDRDGYMKNKANTGAKDYNDRNYTAFRASAVWDITDNLENYTIFHSSQSDTRGYAARIVTCDRSAPGPDAIGMIGLSGMITMAACDQLDRQTQRGDGTLDVESNLTNPFVKIDQWQIINTTTWEINNNLTVKNILSYGEYKERSHFDLYTSNFAIPGSVNFLDFGVPVPVTPGAPFNMIDLDDQPGAAQAQQKTWTEELQLQGQAFDGKLSYVMGGYLEFSRPDGFNAGRASQFANCDRPKSLDCDFSTLPLAGSISQSSNKFDFENHGLFAQGTWAFNDQWALTTGIRYTFDRIKGYDESVSLRPPPFQPDAPLIATCADVFRMPGVVALDPSVCGKTIKQKSEEPTWLVNLDYKPSSNTLIYAKYARGYRQGGVNFTNPGLETWQPEEVDNYELGAKISFDGTIPGYINIAAFYNDYSEQQVFGALITDRVNYPQVIGGNAIVNAGKSRISGLEIDAAAQLFERLRLSLSYAYLDTEIKKINTSSINLAGTPFLAIYPKASAGSPLNFAPEHKFTLTASYSVPISEHLGDVTIGATYTYTDEQLADGAAARPTSHLPSTKLVNLNFDWAHIVGSPFDLSIFITNATNEKYPVGSGGGWTAFGIGDYLYGEPRMYGARLRYNFGR